MANYYKRLNPSDTEVELDVDEPTTIRWGRMVTSFFEPQHPYGAARTFGEKSKGDMKVESLEEHGWRSSPENERDQCGAVGDGKDME